MPLKRIFSLSVLLFFCNPFFIKAQSPTLDSLYSVLEKSNADSSKVDVMNAIGKEYTILGDYGKALGIVTDAKDLAEKISYRKGMGEYYSNLGIIYYYDGNISEALTANFSALKIREQLGDKKGIASTYNNLAILYNYQHNTKEARRYLLSALQIKEELGDKKGMVSTYNNIGLSYSDDRNTIEALKYLNKALEISEQTGNKKGIGNAYHNIGMVYSQNDQNDTALIYYLKALAIRESLGAKIGIVSSLNSIGNAYCGLKQFKLSHSYLDRGIALAKLIGDKEGIKNSYSGYSILGEVEGDYKSAYKNYKLFRQAQDSLVNEENTKKSTRAEMNYQFAKKEAEQDKKEALLEEKAKQQQLTVYFISGILFLVFVFAIFAYRSFIQKRNANKELDSKKHKIEQAYTIIENKNLEITDSINYAKRIQQAILPDQIEIKQAFPESFVFYRPKDIVGGDFYYYSKKTSGHFIATADCTGHGVPGAFMSLIGSKELQIANELSSSPGKILQLLNVGLKETLKQNNLEGTKDGMDIALLKIQNNTVHYAGANRPLWILRKQAVDVEEIKSTKAAIGGYTPDDQIFTEHELQMNSGDTIYFFTDGYSDQFGGKNKEKKLSSKRFRELLTSINSSSLENQFHSIENYFDEWKGNHEQLDDILVIGIRF